MERARWAIVAITFGAILVTGCGDDAMNPGGGGGGDLTCASDSPDVGSMITCPFGDEVIDFCINQRSGDCFYRIGGDTADCGNCLQNQGLNQTCVTEALELCQN